MLKVDNGNGAIVNFRVLVEEQIEFRELKRMNCSCDCYDGFYFVLLLQLILIVRCHRSIERMIIIFFQSIVLKSERILNKCYIEFCIVFSFFLFLCCVRKRTMNALMLKKR